jgi:hypothetical protein
MGISDNMHLTEHERLMSDMAPDLPESIGEPSRLRFWEIDASFKCPVIGWCLDIAEQRKILRKEGMCAKTDHAEQFLPLDLSQIHILTVGGLPKMEGLYRRLIEDSGGMFEYHDGNVSGGIKDLEHQVRRADFILCPVDHNSHAASLAVKRLGKKHGKPVRMLSNSSLSTISQTVLEIQKCMASN